MSAAHKRKLREAAAKRKALIAAGGIPGTTGTTQRQNPVQTLMDAARGNWNAAQIESALLEARRSVAILEGIQRASQGTERSLSQGGGFQTA